MLVTLCGLIPSKADSSLGMNRRRMSMQMWRSFALRSLWLSSFISGVSWLTMSRDSSCQLLSGAICPREARRCRLKTQVLIVGDAIFQEADFASSLLIFFEVLNVLGIDIVEAVTQCFQFVFIVAVPCDGKECKTDDA